MSNVSSNTLPLNAGSTHNEVSASNKRTANTAKTLKTDDYEELRVLQQPPNQCLQLASGEIFEGYSFGYELPQGTSIYGELVFTTSLTGYIETLTDPSFKDQILVFTSPLVGNYGVPPEIDHGLSTADSSHPGSSIGAHEFPDFFESRTVHVAGVVVCVNVETHSHWHAASSLAQWLRKHRVPALSGVDTRHLTQHIVSSPQMARILPLPPRINPYAGVEAVLHAGERLARLSEALPPFSASDPDPEPWRRVCVPAPLELPPVTAPSQDLAPLATHPATAPHVLLLDYGTKANIVRLLQRHGARVRVVPGDGGDIKAHREWADAIVLSNGPGDPARCAAGIKVVRWLLGENERALQELERAGTMRGGARDGRTASGGGAAEERQAEQRNAREKEGGAAHGEAAEHVAWPTAELTAPDETDTTISTSTSSNTPDANASASNLSARASSVATHASPPPRLVPVLGICFGHQLMGLAVGARTLKMPVGHRGVNQACVDTRTGLCYNTAQNHGYCIDSHTLPSEYVPLFLNVADGSIEGVVHRHLPHMAVQFHPEASSGPRDTAFLFHELMLLAQRSAPITTVARLLAPPKPRVKTVLLLGSGGLHIGQAGEFDFSGVQAIKAYKEEGLRVVLVNPNIATVQTSSDMADEVYFCPVTPRYVASVIAKERPQAIALQFGGQTALNCGLELEEKGILSRFSVAVLGTPTQTIRTTEDRQLFADALAEIGERVCPNAVAGTVPATLSAAATLGYPVLLRGAFCLGGLGSGFAADEEELRAAATALLGSVPQVIVDKSLKGWKEVEIEVVRDREGVSVAVCAMENMDPLGIHTGDSVVVAPTQTLNDSEYYTLRSSALRIVAHLGIVGECNVQFALSPTSLDYYVVEVNARLSRSSALATKATGYPLAYVAAKLSLGASLGDLVNKMNGRTSAVSEPALDYIAVKLPVWCTGKFSQADRSLGSAMKSVGEALALGRSFSEAMQKALRMRGEPGWGGYPGARIDVEEVPSTEEAGEKSAEGKEDVVERETTKTQASAAKVTSQARPRSHPRPPRLRVLSACSGGPLAHWTDAQLEQELARPSDHRMLALCECAWRAAAADAEGIARAAMGWGALGALRQGGATAAAEVSGGPAATRQGARVEGEEADVGREVHGTVSEEGLLGYGNHGEIAPGEGKWWKSASSALVAPPQSSITATSTENRDAGGLDKEALSGVTAGVTIEPTAGGRSIGSVATPTATTSSAAAVAAGAQWCVERVCALTGIDRWFLLKLWRLSRVEVATRMGCIGREAKTNGTGSEGDESRRGSSAVETSAGHAATTTTTTNHTAESVSAQTTTPLQQLNGLTHVNSAHTHSLLHTHTLVQELGPHALCRDWPVHVWRAMKQYGYSDQQLCDMTGAKNAWAVRQRRTALGVVPVAKQIDTTAAEVPAASSYLYLTYHGDASDTPPGLGATVVVGCGPYRIGSSCEFDWSAVSCVRELRRLGRSTCVVNNNPETCSTDFDECDRLYFEELSFERVMDICELEQAPHVVVSVGGQAANNIALELGRKVKLAGTSAEHIHTAESRALFSALLDSIGVPQPAWAVADAQGASAFARKVGYPVLLRPSYVLSGDAMRVVKDEPALRAYLRTHVGVDLEDEAEKEKGAQRVGDGESKRGEKEGLASADRDTAPSQRDRRASTGNTEAETTPSARGATAATTQADSTASTSPQLSTGPAVGALSHTQDVETEGGDMCVGAGGAVVHCASASARRSLPERHTRGEEELMAAVLGNTDDKRTAGGSADLNKEPMKSAGEGAGVTSGVRPRRGGEERPEQGRRQGNAGIVVSKFVTGAKEIEFDGVASGGEVVVYAIAEHVENAGVHSGDATLLLPPQRVYTATLRQVLEYSKRIARALHITGPFNVQFLAKDNSVAVIECNLRASRSVPYVSKTLGIDFVAVATRVMLGEPPGVSQPSLIDLPYVCVKAPVFSFARLPGADPAPRVEMASTGEVACLGRDVYLVLLEAMEASGMVIPPVPPRRSRREKAQAQLGERLDAGVTNHSDMGGAPRAGVAQRGGAWTELGAGGSGSDHGSRAHGAAAGETHDHSMGNGMDMGMSAPGDMRGSMGALRRPDMPSSPELLMRSLRRHREVGQPHTATSAASGPSVSSSSSSREHTHAPAGIGAINAGGARSGAPAPLGSPVESGYESDDEGEEAPSDRERVRDWSTDTDGHIHVGHSGGTSMSKDGGSSAGQAHPHKDAHPHPHLLSSTTHPQAHGHGHGHHTPAHAHAHTHAQAHPRIQEDIRRQLHHTRPLMVFSVGPWEDKVALVAAARALWESGYDLAATRGTCGLLRERGLPCVLVRKVSETAEKTDAHTMTTTGGDANKQMAETEGAGAAHGELTEGLVDVIRSRRASLVVNIPRGWAGKVEHTEASDGYAIRRACIESGVALVTNAQVANMVAEGLRRRAIRARALGTTETPVSTYREVVQGRW